MIPLALYFDSRDKQLLDLLYKPGTPVCGLLREEKRVDSEELGELDTRINSSSSPSPGLPSAMLSQTPHASAECMAVAKWWIPEDSDARADLLWSRVACLKGR